MRLKDINQIELSVANMKALIQAVESGVPNPTIHKVIDGQLVAVSVAADSDHYTPEQLATRRSPYLPPEAWAGV